METMMLRLNQEMVKLITLNSLVKQEFLKMGNIVHPVNLTQSITTFCKVKPSEIHSITTKTLTRTLVTLEGHRCQECQSVYYLTSLQAR